MERNDIVINEVEQQAIALPEQAKSIIVCSPETVALADAMRKDLREMTKQVDDFFKPLAEKAYQAHRAITNRWNTVKTPLLSASLYLSNQVKNYITLEEEERKREEKEIAVEAKKNEENRILAEAAQAEKEGRTDEAQAILDAPIYVPTPVVESNVPKVDMRQYKKIPKARVDDKFAVIKAVAMNPALQDLLDVNMSVANKKAKSLGKSLSTIVPGLSYYEE